jgi:hypothetical protein
MKRLVLLGLTIALMSVSAMTQTRRARHTAMTYRVSVSNCNETVMTISFSKKLVTKIVADWDEEVPLAQALNKANGIQSFMVDGNDIQITRSEGVSQETAIANVVLVIAKHFRASVTAAGPTKMAHYQCASDYLRRPLVRAVPRGSSRYASPSYPPPGPRRVTNGPCDCAGPVPPPKRDPWN